MSFVGSSTFTAKFVFCCTVYSEGVKEIVLCFVSVEMMVLLPCPLSLFSDPLSSILCRKKKSKAKSQTRMTASVLKRDSKKKRSRLCVCVIINKRSFELFMCLHRAEIMNFVICFVTLYVFA